MARFNDKYKKARLDQSPFLFHFINGRDYTPYDTLKKILDEQKLRSKKGFICFSASPLTALKEFFKVKMNATGNPLYHPFGIGFSRDILVRDFMAKNVIYTDGTESIPKNLKWRTEKLKVDSYDFEYLREWRIKGGCFDFSKFPKEDIIIIAPNIDCLNHLILNFNMEFTPYVNYYSGDIIEDWEESYTRGWKGIATEQLGEFLNDYKISNLTEPQTIGEDMLPILFSK